MSSSSSLSSPFPPSFVRQISVNSSSAIDVLLRHSFNIRTDSRSLFELLRSENDEKNWSGKYLREQFNKKDLNHLFSKYRSRILQSSFSVGLIFILLFCIVRLITTLVFTKILDTFICACLYGVTCLVCGILLALIFAEKQFFWNWKSFPLVISVILLLLLALNDYAYIIINMKNCYTPRLSPTFIFIIITYYFLPFPKLYMALAGGVCLSVAELCFSVFVFYAKLAEDSEKYRLYPLTADAIFLLASNLLGLYRMYLDDVNQRRGFLDHHLCIESQIKCDLEKVQEEHLMLSVVPPYILDSIKKDVRDGIQLRHLEPRPAKLFGDFYIKKHSNVSILFSDIVNFTVLTCTLEVHELVILLSRLFGRFDDIASKNACERIRIVGDCYVAASGLPPHHLSESHAHDCIEQAIGMLDIIREVKRELRVNVDMRIGVHSGYVMSGILGVRKWQYDIWSNDVDIANLMEHTGKPGMIHISNATFKLLGGNSQNSAMSSNISYGIVEDGGTRTIYNDHHHDQVLQNKSNTSVRPCWRDTCNIISGDGALEPVEELPDDCEEDEGKGESIRKSSSELNLSLLGGIYQCRLGEEVQFKDKEMKTYYIIPTSVDNQDCVDDKHSSRYSVNRRRASYLASRVKHASLRRISLQSFSTDSRPSVEHSPLEISSMKFEKLLNHVNSEMSVAIGKMALSKREQWSSFTRIHPLYLSLQPPYSEIEYVKQADPLFKYYLLTVGLIFVGLFAMNSLTTSSKNLFIILPYLLAMVPLMMLIYFAWHDIIINTRNDSGDGGKLHMSPRTHLNSIFTSWSRCVSTSFMIRSIIWLFVAFLLSSMVLSNVVLCIFVKDFKCATNVTEFGITRVQYPRYFIYSAALVITSIAFFLHIHFLMKLLVYVLALITYYLVTFFIRGYLIYETFLPGYFIVDQFPIDESVFITFIVLCHHLVDRQMEYLSRLDFMWKQDLRAKREDSNVMSLVNKFLVQNIVPVHVIDYYLNSRQVNEFYHERHDKVAVMFASIQNFLYCDESNGIKDSEMTSLKLLNEVITNMDNLLLNPEFSRVEKIKVVGTTYMTAAGLKPNVRRNSDEYEELEPFDVETNVVTLVNLATAMMQALENFNGYSFQEYELRVGIDCGPSMAGVVGNNKPIYDVWGNAVNVASRMESTGEVGKIQVTEETANILLKAGYKCECRGQVFVKGKGVLTTYFVTESASPELYQLRVNTSSNCHINDVEDTTL